MNILNPHRIKYSEVESDVHGYLGKTYAQKRSVFSVASVYGQILKVLKSFWQLLMLMLEDSIVENNIYTASKQRAIYGLSRLAGHNPTRALSAQGTIRMKIKASALADLNASYIDIVDRTTLKCTDNSLPYFIQLGESLDSIRINISDREFHRVTIVQGKVESQSLIGTGQALQSFNIKAKKPIENELVFVKVNGVSYEVVDSLYDMRKGENLCIVKTSVIDGIDLTFGNEDYGVIPPLGSLITVEYVTSDGFEGNIYSKSDRIEFKWDGEAITDTGEQVDLNEVLDVFIDKPIVLGADNEPIELTKLIAPKTSRSYVLANPDNYVNLLSRFNYSYVDAYTTFDDDYLDDDNVVYLFLIPDLSRRLEKNTDYYTTPLTSFYLDTDEKDALVSWIHQSGRMIASTELQIVDPIVKKYALNIFLRIFDWADASTARSMAISKVTDYMLTVNRRDKIPKSDLIAILEGIKGIDSVHVNFVSEENEKAIIDGWYTKRSYQTDRIRGLKTLVETRVNLTDGDDPRLGLDDFGDIKIGLNEMPLFRGGWYDRFGAYYDDGLTDHNSCSVNVVIKEVIQDSVAKRIAAKNKEALKR